MTKNIRIDKSLKKLAASNAGCKIKIRAKETKTQGFSIYLDYYFNLQRNYEFLGLYLTGDQDHDSTSIAHAYEIRKIRETEISYRAAGSQAVSWKRKSDIKEYIASITKNKNRVWKAMLYALNSFHPDPLSFTAIDRHFAESFKEYLLERYSRSTAWTYFSLLRGTVNSAVKDQILLSNPISSVTIRKVDPERVFLTTEEVNCLHETPSDKPEIDRAFLFACYTGLRISDVYLLDWDSIDYRENTIKIRMKKTSNMLYIPLIPQAKALLGDLGAGKVFNLPSQAFVNRHLKKWAQEAGINKAITFHTARHTFAILGIDAGIGIHVIQKLLGHSAIDVTMVYAKVRDKNLNEAAQRMQDHLEKNKPHNHKGEPCQ